MPSRLSPLVGAPLTRTTSEFRTSCINLIDRLRRFTERGWASGFLSCAQGVQIPDTSKACSKPIGRTNSTFDLWNLELVASVPGLGTDSRISRILVACVCMDGPTASVARTAWTDSFKSNICLAEGKPSAENHSGQRGGTQTTSHLQIGQHRYLHGTISPMFWLQISSHSGSLRHT